MAGRAACVILFFILRKSMGLAPFCKWFSRPALKIKQASLIPSDGHTAMLMFLRFQCLITSSLMFVCLSINSGSNKESYIWWWKFYHQKIHWSCHETWNCSYLRRSMSRPYFFCKSCIGLSRATSGTEILGTFWKCWWKCRGWLTCTCESCLVSYMLTDAPLSKWYTFFPPDECQIGMNYTTWPLTCKLYV